MFAHGNILVGPLDLGSPFRRIRGGSILLLLSVLFFIFGLYRVLSPAFSPAITNAAVLSSAWAEGIMQAFGLLMLALMLFLTLAMIGSKQSLPIAYGFLVVFSAYGLFGMVQTSITGVWAPTAETAAIVWIIVAVLLFYEPTFRFINNYTAVPFSFSLEYKLRINKNLIMGRYDITHGRRIDTGGFAIIYEGLDVLTNGEVILKEPKANPNDTDAVESLQYAIKQLEKESDVLKTLDFPGIVKYVDFFQEGGRYFMVEERIYGRTLGEISRKGRLQFSQPEAIMYTLEVLYALNYLHMHGELHRDLSCNNVMITSQGKIKLIDFGLAKKMVRMATTGFHRGQTGAPGTDGYCAPERDQALLLGEVSLSFPYDIYSVGALMYLMLSGDHPPLVVVSNTVDAALGGKCDARIVSVVKKAMAIDPQDRYQSAFEMIAAINDYKGRFIVTDFTEVYDLTGCSQAELLNDPSYKPVPGKLFRGVVDKIHLETTKKNMSAGSITLNKNVNQYELVAEKGVSFNILSKDLEKEGVKKYFLGKNALFWLDEGHRTCRNGVFSYVEV
jgi:serine/threonine-protein kinase